MKWEAFRPAEKPIPSIKYLKRKAGLTKAQALEWQAWAARGVCYLNNLYQVEVREADVRSDDWPTMVWLSIKRRDKKTIHDWRDIQRIKNELIGSECEGVEIYPAESRMVDTANQYHLWVILEPGIRFPFGFNDGRRVTGSDAAEAMGAKQRDISKKRGS